MSTPRFLDLPPCARATTISTERGTFAAHLAEPETALPETALPETLPETALPEAARTAPANAAPANAALANTGSADAAGTGATAVLVPGFTGSKEDFIGLLDPLSRRGYRVVAIDPRGQYQTPGPADEAPYNLDELAADLVAVCASVAKRVPGPLHLLGHSFGGVVARYAVRSRPDQVSSLTLLCSGPGALAGRPAERVALQLSALEQFDLDTVAELRERAGEGDGHPARVVAFLRKRFTANSKTALIAQSRYLLTAESSDDELAGLRATAVPVLVAHGAADDAWPIDEQAAMAVRLGAAYEVIPGAGHSPAVEDPNATADVLSYFWKRAELLTT